jgi:hypothetical protein
LTRCSTEKFLPRARFINVSYSTSASTSLALKAFHDPVEDIEDGRPTVKRLFTLYGNFAMHGRFGSLSRAFVIVASIVGCGRVFAGSPPLITDDPETPGYKGWEINITSSLEHSREGVEMENPLFDINYGLTSDRDQLKVEFAVASNDPDNADVEWGISDLLVGYKYRFLDADENHGWAVSFYPQVSSPTGDESRDLGSGQTELLIPFEFQKSFCDDKVWQHRPK